MGYRAPTNIPQNKTTILCDLGPRRCWWNGLLWCLYDRTCLLISGSLQGFLCCNANSGCSQYLESWAVASAINNLQTRAVDYSKIIIYTDSMNIADICNSLWCLPDFYPLLCFYIDTCWSMNFDICILHIPGECNGVADTISCNNFDKAWKLVPGLNILKFKPPQFTMLGAAKKWFCLMCAHSNPLGSHGCMSTWSVNGLLL